MLTETHTHYQTVPFWKRKRVVKAVLAFAKRFGYKIKIIDVPGLFGTTYAFTLTYPYEHRWLVPQAFLTTIYCA